MDPFYTAFMHELVKTGAAAARSILTPQSSNVRGYSYDPAEGALTVTYKSGGTYRYSGVPPAAARSLGRSKSVGKAINRLVKAPGYSYEKVGAEVPAEHQADMAKAKVLIDAAIARHMRHADKSEPTSEASQQQLMDELKGARSVLFGKEAFADVGAIAAATRGMPLGTKKGRRPPKPTGSLAKQASSIIGFFDQSHRSIAKLAGVAKKQITWGGLRMKIEYEPGDIRSGKSKDGKTWERKMYASYGYIPGTKGAAADGDAIDVYFAAEPVDGAPVFEIRQEKKDGGYDESKFMIGWPSAEEAKKAYLQHMPEWAFGSIEQVADSANSFAEKVITTEKAAHQAKLPSLLGGFTDELAKAAGAMLGQLALGTAAGSELS